MVMFRVYVEINKSFSFPVEASSKEEAIQLVQSAIDHESTEIGNMIFPGFFEDSEFKLDAELDTEECEEIGL